MEALSKQPEREVIMPDPIISKTCKKCGEVKPFSMFYANKGGKHGLRSNCKKCQDIMTSDWDKANPERRKARKDAFYQANAKRISERDSAKHAANPEKQRARSAAKYAANPEKAKACSADWARRNPEARNAIARNRRAIARQAAGRHTSSDVLELLSLQQCMCVVCRTNIKNDYHVDHIIPLSKGGGNGKDNLQLLCPTCNLQKHAKHPVDFMQSRGFLL
jgi:5-methylcytosine-specific restriction endonuclease McrA